MINNETTFKHKGLEELYNNPRRTPAKIDSTLIKRVRVVLAHLETAESLHDIASGLGEVRNYHRLQPLSDGRHSLDVNGNYRITFEVTNNSTGHVTAIDLEDTH